MWIPSIVALLLILNEIDGTTVENYLKIRENLIREEKSEFFGANLELSKDEIIVNEYLMSAKLKDVDKGFKNSAEFWPSRNFLDVRKNIEQSELFKIIRMIPKGAVLHTHGGSTASHDFLYENLTRLPNLYVCLVNKTVRFRFFETPSKDCNWELMAELRKKDPNITVKLRDNVTLPVKESTPEYNVAMTWDNFAEMFIILEGLILYRPAFEIYLQRSLQELWHDNIFYMEFRAPVYRVYELNGTVHEPIDTIRIFKRVVDEFVVDHPGFIGAKYIHTSDRMFNREEFKEDLKIYKDIKRAFPDLVVGFDVSNHEDKGHPDVYYIQELLDMSNETSFLHAGETSWSGHFVDENMFDAILLNTTRIGHGFALLKHPKLMDMVKERNIAIEVNPISNQVLGYVDDLRNHPAVYYFAKNLPVIISNDNPSFWGASGLSYDFYETFVGIMPRNADLRSLKQLIINSIEYSGMTKEDKQSAFKTWENSWHTFVQSVVHKTFQFQ